MTQFKLTLGGKGLNLFCGLAGMFGLGIVTHWNLSALFFGFVAALHFPDKGSLEIEKDKK